jgi:hypothetical protein
MTEKKSFVIHIDSLNVLDDLTDEQAGKLFKAIKAYQNNENIELESIIKIAFSPFKNQFSRDLGSYKNRCEQNKINGLKGGRPKKQNGFQESEKTELVIQKPKKADSDSDSDSDSDNKDKKPSRFTPPTHEQVLSYMTENGYPYNHESEKFIDFYSMKGWMVGKNKMKDWKAAVRNWLKNCKLPEKKINTQPVDTFDYNSAEARKAQMDKEVQELMDFVPNVRY